MAYGRIYIDNLCKKVTALFDELRADNRLCEKNFIEAFKQKYPKDYAMLQYEWEFKVHEFKKNRKGSPKPHPIRPEKILSNMYRNYYYKLVKNPVSKKAKKIDKKKELSAVFSAAGISGYKIRSDGNNAFNVINKEIGKMEYKGLSYKKLKEMFPLQDKKKGAKKNAKNGYKQT